jgi:N-acetylmuramoyl-L-alanine amidase
MMLRLVLFSLFCLISLDLQAASDKVHTKSFVVVIDAGHGGKDSGAIGPSGIQEKDIVLAIARRLRDFIRAESGMKAVMVRNDDHFVDLKQRAEIAQKAQADLFISLHADAYEDGAVKGSTVFVLSENGASSEAARTLADRENAGEVGGVDLGAEDAMVASVLVDLSKNANREASEKAARSVMLSLAHDFKIHSSTVQKAGFRVLKSLDVPSVLIETGFISSQDEESRLSDPKQQDRLARALFKGIQALLRR